MSESSFESDVSSCYDQHQWSGPGNEGEAKMLLAFQVA